MAQMGDTISGNGNGLESICGTGWGSKYPDENYGVKHDKKGKCRVKSLYHLVTHAFCNDPLF